MAFGWYIDSCQDAYMVDCAIARNHDSCHMWSGHFLHISDRRVISIWNCSRVGSLGPRRWIRGNTMSIVFSRGDGSRRG